MASEVVVYCDESDVNGKHFSNFYGGIAIRSTHLKEVESRLNSVKAELHFRDEVKWQKVTENYLTKYQELVDAFFEEIREDRVKVRIMFTQNRYVPIGLTARHRADRFFILYYEFIKHAFGLRYLKDLEGPFRARLLFDRLPDTKEKIASFKGFLAGLNKSPGFGDGGVYVDPLQIAEVDSHQHVLLQCLDIVLGAMQFRLNDKHLEKPPGARVRGRRTRAKEKLYKHVLGRVRELYPGFNPGVSTNHEGDVANRWSHRYRHWVFVPSNKRVDSTQGKHK